MQQHRTIAFARKLALLALLLSLLWHSAGAQAAGTATVQISNTVELTSALEMGITHTHQSLIGSRDQAVQARLSAQLDSSVGYQNQHIMGWGAGNPEPSPGKYDFTSLDTRLAQMKAYGAQPVITLCCAPDWMKGGQAGTTDWSRLELAPRPEHYADFARLAASVAKRYPQVKYFQIWNEFKGFWDSSANDWNYRAYTEMYNQVYRAVKQARPDAKVGGFYMVVEGTGSNPTGSLAQQMPLTARQATALDYWLKNSAGADFVCVDKATKSYHDPASYTTDELLALTQNFGTAARAIRSKTNLPIWWSEYYVPGQRDDGSVVAGTASVLAHMLRNGSNVALLWQETRLNYAIYDSAGQPLPSASVLPWFHQYFGPGTPIYRATSSDPLIEVLAGPRKTMLINKDRVQKSVQVNGRAYTLAPYAVQLIATPGTAKPVTVDDSAQGSGDNQFSFVKSGWKHCADCEPAKYQRSDSWNSTAGAYATISFRGTGITLYGAKAPHHGIAAVSVDGGPEQKIDYYASARADNVALWASPQLTAGAHTLKVRVTGSKNAASDGAVITIDRVDIRP
jgi:hypothetical protein